MKRRALTVGALLCTGCSLLLGKPYQQMPSVPPGMSVIYFYAGDVRPLQTVLVDTTPHSPSAEVSIAMVDGGYYPYLHEPGVLRLLTNVDTDEPACVTIETVSGFHYWVRVAKPGASTRPIEIVSPAEGESEIAGHRKISGEGRSDSDDRYEVDCPQNGAEGTR